MSVAPSIEDFHTNAEKVPLSLLLLSRVFAMGSESTLVDILARRLTIEDRRKLGARFLRERLRASKALDVAVQRSDFRADANTSRNARETTTFPANKQSIQSTEPGIRSTSDPPVLCDLPSILPILGQEIALLRAFVAQELNAILFNVENP